MSGHHATLLRETVQDTPLYFGVYIPLNYIIWLVLKLFTKTRYQFKGQDIALPSIPVKNSEVIAIKNNHFCNCKSSYEKIGSFCYCTIY